MELRQLEYFVAVAEEASFTRGAERVLVAQSGVSAQVRRLERELGSRSWSAARATVTPTEAGAGGAAVRARRRWRPPRACARPSSELTGLHRGHVRVGMITAGPAVTLDDLLASFHRAHPGVEITLVGERLGRRCSRRPRRDARPRVRVARRRRRRTGSRLARDHRRADRGRRQRRSSAGAALRRSRSRSCRTTR